MLQIFNWFKRKEKKTSQDAQECYVIPIIKKEDLIDGYDYQHFVNYSSKKCLNISDNATWNKSRECFIGDNKIIEYEDYKPIHCLGPNHDGWHWHQDDWDLKTISSNQFGLTMFDIEELRKILYCMVDDNVQSDDIYEKLLDWMEKRGLSEWKV